MADMEVLNWARRYVKENSVTALAGMTATYDRATISLYINEKYPADTTAIERVLRPLMSLRICPFLTLEITDKDCKSRASRPKPHSTGSAMEAHWKACQRCPHNQGDQHE